MEAISKFNEIEKVIIFGSRAVGNYKKGSDVDLAIVGTDVNKKIIRDLNEELNENYPLPYYFDLLNLNELIKHIKDFGILIYEKS